MERARRLSVVAFAVKNHSESLNKLRLKYLLVMGSSFFEKGIPFLPAELRFMIWDKLTGKCNYGCGEGTKKCCFCSDRRLVPTNPKVRQKFYCQECRNG